jgi:hypothetical protein
MNKKFSFVEEKQIIDDNKKGLDKKQLCMKWIASKSCIDGIFKRHCRQYIRPYKRHHNANKWNTSFFQEMTPLTAYWAGFIYADGCVRKIGKISQLEVGLTECDKNHLMKLCDALQLGHKHINFRKGRKNKNGSTSKPTCRIKIAKKGIEHDLSVWGIVENKTYDFHAPIFPQKLLKHFLRGVIDGDGYISTKKYKERIRITGNKEFLNWLSIHINETGYIGSINRTEWYEGNVWGKLVINGKNQIKQLTQHILHTPYMNRKWNKLNEF